MLQEKSVLGIIFSMNTDNFTPPFKKKTTHIKCYSGKKIANVTSSLLVFTSLFQMLFIVQLLKDNGSKTLTFQQYVHGLCVRFSATSQLQKSLGGTKQHHHNLFKF